MGRNEHYWENKSTRADKAKQHSAAMERRYAKEIQDSSANTHIYTGKVENLQKRGIPTAQKISVELIDSVTAVTMYATGMYGKPAVLNFASYKNPGGMFLNGSKAQEECLCHESNLYNILVRHENYYEENHKNLNRALYKNRALYSPMVVFEREGIAYLCDVITCAAPNKAAAMQYGRVTEAENSTVLRDRIRFLLDIAEKEKVDILILGAYGAGVFGQDPTEVATIFKEELSNGYGFSKIVFAVIPGRDMSNVDAFKRVFDN